MGLPPQNPLNIDLKIDVDIANINERYGIQPKEKLGDIIVESTHRERLEKIVGNHYKKNHMRDWEEQLREVKMYYSFGAAATRDMALLKEKYKEIKTLVDQQEGKKPRIQVSIFDEIGGQDLLHQNSDTAHYEQQ